MLTAFVAASLIALTAPATADPTQRVGVALIVGGTAIGVSMALDRRWSGVAVGAVSVVFGRSCATIRIGSSSRSSDRSRRSQP
jgi:uncharacterized membrane protein HdeD (DUF308 family)